MKPIIYTQRVEIIEHYQERRDCTDQRIADFIFECGYLPFPIANKSEILEEIIHIVNPAGILLTGGNSLVKYGGNAPERDEVDNKLIELSIMEKIPLYGICRGMQSILDYFGNELVDVQGHVAVRHTVSRDNKSYEVNSYHNQGCIHLSENMGLYVTAQAEDGVIEAICHNHYPIWGTMWHPEREENFSKRDIEFFKGIMK